MERRHGIHVVFHSCQQVGHSSALVIVRVGFMYLVPQPFYGIHPRAVYRLSGFPPLNHVYPSECGVSNTVVAIPNGVLTLCGFCYIKQDVIFFLYAQRGFIAPELMLIVTNGT